MNKNRKENKKGLSEMISYVLLIVIAIGLSVGVFAYLKLYVPGEKQECNADISLTLEKYSCSLESSSNAQMNLSFLNRGLFKTDAVYLRFGESGREVLPLINDINDIGKSISIHKFYLSKGPEEIVSANNPPTGLNPGETSQRSYNVSIKSGVYSYSLEIEPGISSGDKVLACSSAVITQPITCR